MQVTPLHARFQNSNEPSDWATREKSVQPSYWKANGLGPCEKRRKVEVEVRAEVCRKRSESDWRKVTT